MTILPNDYSQEIDKIMFKLYRLIEAVRTRKALHNEKTIPFYTSRKVFVDYLDIATAMY